MSWCDKLASVPTVGFKLNNHFAPIDTLLNAMFPIFDRIPEGQAKNVTVEQSTTAFATAFTTNDGFKYVLSEGSVSVAFNHRVRFRQVSGGPPTMEMLSKPMPFTTLLPGVFDKLVEATLLMPEASKRTINRVGIISTTPIAEEDIPPGIKRMLEYVARPWKGKFENFNVSLNMIINDAGETTDRCIHTIIKPDDSEQLMTLQFDWQRIFKTPWTVTKANCERALKEAQKEALKYFEDLAEGSRFDEVLLRESAAV